MKINENTRIVGTNVILVPYCEHHVQKYHDWMKSEELQLLTASEPLSLEEEFAMQKSWHLDEDKCTFIILDKLILDQSGNEIDAMIGDTNLFFSQSEPHEAEAEIMIAEVPARGNKRGWEALLLMLRYGCELLHVTKYEAKININNTRSIQMFKKIAFSEVSRSSVFSEITFKKSVCDDWLQWLHDETQNFVIEKYEAQVGK